MNYYVNNGLKKLTGDQANTTARFGPCAVGLHCQCL